MAKEAPNKMAKEASASPWFDVICLLILKCFIAKV
jgi:hypothetical protein